MKNRMVKMVTAPALALGMLALGACDDPTTVEEHLEAAGFVVMVDGTEALRHMDTDGGTPTLGLTAGVVYDVEVALLDEDGTELVADHSAGETHEDELGLTLLDTSVATWTPEAHTGTTEPEHVAAHGVLETLTAGSSTVELCLQHEGHCDYETVFTLDVTAP